jgi:predicted nucleic acid-binding protein
MRIPAIPDRFVLDGSVTLAWLFHDEQDPYADAIIGKLPHLEMLVPRIWHLEVANVLLVGERRGRCSQADTTSWLGFLSALPILVDGSTEARAWSDTINLARQQSLTEYDAAYLELALREGLPLATLDSKLEAAATAVGVPRYQP